MKQIKPSLIYFFFFLLCSIGLEYELSVFYGANLSNQQYLLTFEGANHHRNSHSLPFYLEFTLRDLADTSFYPPRYSRSSVLTLLQIYFIGQQTVSFLIRKGLFLFIHKFQTFTEYSAFLCYNSPK